MARQYGLFGFGAPLYINETALRQYGFFTGYINETQSGSTAVSVSVTGVEAVSALGSVGVSPLANISVTGVDAFSALGSVSVSLSAGVNVTLTGLGAVSALGSVGTAAKANVTLTGLGAVSALGSAGVAAKANTTVTGVAATGTPGSAGVFINPVVASPYRDYVIRDGASNYWRLDETTAAPVLDLVGGLNGSNVGPVFRSQPGAIVTDPTNTCTRYTGSGSYAAIPGPVVTPIVCSVELWAKYTTVGDVGGYVLFSNVIANNDGFFISVGGGVLSVWISNLNFTGAKVINDGQWHYIVVTTDGVTARVYVDNVLDVSGACVRTAAGTDTLGLAYDQRNFNLYFPGYLDEVAVYPKCLTQSQITSHYQKALLPFPTGGPIVTWAWGRSGWGTGPWGTAVYPAPLTANLGSVGVSVRVATSVTGLGAVAALGSVTVTAKANTAVTGLQLTTALGSVTETAGAKVTLTGLNAVASVGVVEAVFGVLVPVTGVQGTASVGQVIGALPVTFGVTGVAAVASVGNVGVAISALVHPVGLQAVTSLGSVVAKPNISVFVTGVSAHGSVGLVSVTGFARVFPTGVEARALLDSAFGPAVLVWGLVNDSQVPDWTPVDDTQVDTWVPVVFVQNPRWLPVVDG